LHLVGYEHDNLKNYKEMHLLERKLLAIIWPKLNKKVLSKN
jgi:ssRNA-specific RNase YbeY (16S rRNA maturation enzyme)